MKNEKTSKNIHITFHNPNTPDEIANFLIKTIADNMSEYLIKQKTLLLLKETDAAKIIK